MLICFYFSTFLTSLASNTAAHNSNLGTDIDRVGATFDFAHNSLETIFPCESEDVT